MSKQAGTNRAPTDSSGSAPALARELLVQLQPGGRQSWQPAVCQLERALCPAECQVPCVTALQALLVWPSVIL